MSKKTQIETTRGNGSVLTPALGGSDKSPHKVWTATFSMMESFKGIIQ